MSSLVGRCAVRFEIAPMLPDVDGLLDKSILVATPSLFEGDPHGARRAVVTRMPRTRRSAPVAAPRPVRPRATPFLPSELSASRLRLSDARNPFGRSTGATTLD